MVPVQYHPASRNEQNLGLSAHRHFLRSLSFPVQLTSCLIRPTPSLTMTMVLKRAVLKINRNAPHQFSPSSKTKWFGDSSTWRITSAVACSFIRRPMRAMSANRFPRLAVEVVAETLCRSRQHQPCLPYELRVSRRITTELDIALATANQVPWYCMSPCQRVNISEPNALLSNDRSAYWPRKVLLRRDIVLARESRWLQSSQVALTLALNLTDLRYNHVSNVTSRVDME